MCRCCIIIGFLKDKYQPGRPKSRELGSLFKGDRRRRMDKQINKCLFRKKVYILNL